MRPGLRRPPRDPETPITLLDLIDRAIDDDGRTRRLAWLLAIVIIGSSVTFWGALLLDDRSLATQLLPLLPISLVGTGAALGLRRGLRPRPPGHRPHPRPAPPRDTTRT